MTRTSQFLAVIGVLILFLPVVRSQQTRSSDNSISGDWEGTVSRAGQTSKIRLRITVDGERAVIETISPEGMITSLTGTWIGNKLSAIEENPAVTLTITAVLQADKLIGDINVTPKNGSPIVAKWEANRMVSQSQQSPASSQTAIKDVPKEAKGQESREATPEERELFFLMRDLDDGVGRGLEAAIRVGNLGPKAKAAIPKLQALAQLTVDTAIKDEWLLERAEDVQREATIALKRIKTPATGRKSVSGGNTVELVAIERDTGQSSRYVPNKPEHIWIRVSFKTDDPNLTAEKIRANDGLCGSIRADQGSLYSPSGGGLLDGNPVCVYAVWKKALNLSMELPGYPPLPLGF